MENELDEFIRYLNAERNASPYTVRNYRREISEFMLFAREAGVAVWTEVDRSLVLRWLQSLKERGIVAPSVSRRLYTLRSFFKFMQREDLIPGNPLLQVSGPKLPIRNPRYLSVKETVALLAAGGLRIGELVGLDLDSVDMQAKTALVRGKGDVERLALFGDFCVSALRAYLSGGRPGLVIEHKNSRALFLNHLGTRLEAQTVQDNIQRYAKQAGIKQRVTPHLLRHTLTCVPSRSCSVTKD
jgi:integrase/recombinase XerC